MSLAELMLILIVAMVVFGPSRLPKLVRHLERIFTYLNKVRSQLSKLWDAQLRTLQLEENQQKAKQADKAYKKQR